MCSDQLIGNTFSATNTMQINFEMFLLRTILYSVYICWKASMVLQYLSSTSMSMSRFTQLKSSSICKSFDFRINSNRLSTKNMDRKILDEVQFQNFEVFQLCNFIDESIGLGCFSNFWGRVKSNLNFDPG